MQLTKHKIGEFVRPISIKCGDSKYKNVSGINIDKKFMPSRNVGADTSKYLVVPPNCFAFNLMHVGRDEKIPVALNDSNENVIVSPAYFVFEIIDESIILRRYFYMIMSSPEFDRYAWFCTDSSIRGNLEWKRFTEIELHLPDIETQKKYVMVYESMEENIRTYKAGLENLHLTCTAYIEKLISELPKQPIGNYIEQSDEKNHHLIYGKDDVRGISINKIFIDTKANMNNVSLAPYLIVRPDYFSYVTVTSRNGEKISIAHNATKDTYLVSSSYIVFKVNSEVLLPSYLFMFLSKNEFDRYARFNSWGSAREVLNWEDLCRFEIPIPSLKVQRDIIEIFNEYNIRKQLIVKLESLQKKICPVLIKGALEESTKIMG